MAKFLCFTLLFLTMGLALARHEGGILQFFNGWPFSAPGPSSICANITAVQLYRAQTLLLINTLYANASTNAILQLEAVNFVSYLTNANNQALITSNCTAFAIGLKNAKLADETAEHTRMHLTSNIEHQFEQIAKNTIGASGAYYLDSGEHHGHH